MGRIRRYYSALSRYHKSKGYGIHSPFAFSFVLNVLRERLPYYTYDDLNILRHFVIDQTRQHFTHPAVISFKSAKLVFRVANYFNPPEILQFGTSYGVSSASVLAVSSKSHLVLCEPKLMQYPVTEHVLEPIRNRISVYDDAASAIAAYKRGKSVPFILINAINNGDLPAISKYLHSIFKSGEAVVIIRNISRSDTIKSLWLDCKASIPSGMTFSNEKLAVITSNEKLPRQDFFLWF
ncbi:MAG: hypothetical protein LKF31_01330 [Muribaculaceae bacterium]|nr:hypothetical protein [Muribaculaceae bacterium]